MTLRMPQPPVDNESESLKRSITDIINFLRQFHQNGGKHTSFTQAQIDSFITTDYLGTIVFNTDTNESNVSYLDNGDVKWRAI